MIDGNRDADSNFTKLKILARSGWSARVIIPRQLGCETMNPR
jgi:hypothetical protein